MTTVKTLSLISLLSLSLVLNSCIKKEDIPSITNISIASVKTVKDTITAEVHLTIYNPSPYEITVRLTSLQILKDHEPLLSEMTSVPVYTITNGYNQIILPISIKQDKLVKHAIKLFINSKTAFDITGSFIYHYSTFKGKFYFNQTISLDLNSILDSLLNSINLN